jgi:hypothetical protein
VLLLRVIQGVEGGSVQHLKYSEEEWCIEWTWHREHKRKKNIKHNEKCAGRQNAGRAGHCSRTMMRPISH